MKNKVPPLTLEDLGVPTAEINREFIIRLDQGQEYIVNRIAEISKILEHLSSIQSALALRVTALEGVGDQ